MKKKPAPDEQKIWYENDPDLGRVKKYRSWAGTLIIWDEMLHLLLNQDHFLESNKVGELKRVAKSLIRFLANFMYSLLIS